MEVENSGGPTEETVDADYSDLPGFRFHPTDEELVGFYLQRKVEKKRLRPELIKEADIYKFDPWDLPRSSNGGAEKEWYFFCKRGRKYKNSIRPNRVTSSGFWKATGIDRPIYSSSGDIIGLKKSLVYYRGSAGKGTKTEWMMHEFRLPPHQADENSVPQDAEVWTLCRILKRSTSHAKCSSSSQLKASASSFSPGIDPPSDHSSPETVSIASDVHNINLMQAIAASHKSPTFSHCIGNEQDWSHSSAPTLIPQAQRTTVWSSFMYDEIGNPSDFRDWDLQSIVNHASSSPTFYR